MHQASSFATAALLLLGIACSPAPPTTTGPPDILLVTIDTARADHFSFMGTSPAATPNIDAVAAGGVVFTRATSQAPLTLPAHASLLTGLEPPQHGVRNNGSYRLPDASQTLAEQLREAGYRTGAFVASAVLDARYGLDQGFDVYDDDLSRGQHFEAFAYSYRRAEQVVAPALAWIASGADAPLFVWIHLFDPHKPLDPPEPERSAYPESMYAAEIAYADRAIGDFLEGHRELRPRTPTLTIITSDHGESMGEHGEATHGIFIYDATLHIPLVIRSPGIDPARSDVPVSLVDILPTLLDLLDLPAARDVAGQSLAPLLRGASDLPPQRSIYAESLFPRLSYGWSELRSLRAGRFKLIVGVEPELFDLEQDPRELRDLAPRQPERVAQLGEQLAARHAGHSPPDAGIGIDASERERLAALGYVTSPAAPPAGGPAPADPREQIHILEGIQRTVRLYQSHRVGDALALAESLVAEDPNNPQLLSELGFLRERSGSPDAALAAYERASARSPADPELWKKQARLLRALGRLGDAAEAYARAIALDDADAAARRARWTLLLATDGATSVVEETAAWLARHPGDGRAIALQILAEHPGEPTADTRKRFETAILAHPDDPHLRVSLARVLIELGDMNAAVEQLRHGLAADASDTSAATTLGHILMDRGETREALAALTAAEAPRIAEPAFWILLAEARHASGDLPGAVAAARKAVEHGPGRADHWARLGQLEWASGDGLRASASLERARRLGLDSPELSGLLAEIYDAEGKPSQARAARARIAEAAARTAD